MTGAYPKARRPPDAASCRAGGASLKPDGRLMTTSLTLGFDATFEALHERDGLVALDARFLDFVGEDDPGLKDRLAAARRAPGDLVRDAESELILALAPRLEAFLGQLFGVESELAAMRAERDGLAVIFAMKRLFVQRRAIRKHPDAEGFDGAALRGDLEKLLGGPLSELRFAQAVDAWLKAEDAHAEALELAARYAAWATLS